MANLFIDIYWDFESLRNNKMVKFIDVTNQLRYCLRSFGIVSRRNIYIDSQNPSEIKTKRGDMCMSGWNVIDTPHRNKKETIDKKIILDVMTSLIMNSCERDKVMVCIITNDADFSELLSRIRDFGVHTCLFYGNSPSDSLMNTADYSFNWNEDIIGRINSSSLYHDIELDEAELAIFAQKVADIDVSVSKIDYDYYFPEASYIPDFPIKSDVKSEVREIELSNQEEKSGDVNIILNIGKRLRDTSCCVRVDAIATQWYKHNRCNNMSKKQKQKKLREVLVNAINLGLVKKLSKKEKLKLNQKTGDVVMITDRGLSR